MMQTEITRLLGIKYPIIQGGMAWVAEHHLAAAVSEAGGLGLIGAASAPAESAPPAESAAHNGGENNASSAESTPQTGVAVPSAEESGGVQQPSVQTGALTEPGA